MKTNSQNSAKSERTRGPWGAAFPRCDCLTVLHDPRQPAGLNHAGATPARRSAPLILFPARAARGRGKSLRGLLLRFLNACRNEVTYARNIRFLEQLDDRSLRDIGITHRAEIPHLVRHGRWRR
ncbi:DUF1127 domain-containing protein [Pelagibius sp. 7325]|uniref:DUF1127 domain-containing protein n=1 Tax=Pelagibius sp. 7325 TaxID=3131994 RepID=UPI0034601105